MTFPKAIWERVCLAHNSEGNENFTRQMVTLAILHLQKRFKLINFSEKYR